MQCIITTPMYTETYSNLVSISIPTKKGISQIKKGHAEYFTNVTAGSVLCVTKAGKTTELNIAEGVCRVDDDTVTLII